MADFDPDAYLAQPSGGGSGGGFDPDQYLKNTPSYGTMESGFEGYLKGASANWRDEIYGASEASGLPRILGGFRAPVGAGRLAYEHLTGKQGEAIKEYQRARDEIRAREAAMQQQHPTAFGTGEVTGAIGSALAVPGPGAASIPGRIGMSALTGAGYGAVAGAGEGEGAADTLKGAGTGAVTGGLFGSVGSGMAEAASPLMSRIGNVVRGIRDPDAEAARRIVSHLEADNASRQPWTPEMINEANVAGTPRAIIDAGGESTRALARSAANTSQQARSALTEYTQERFQQQSPRIAAYIRHITQGADAVGDLERIQDVARRSNRPAYRAAYAAGENGLWTPELERLAGAPAVRQAMQNAVQRGRDRAVSEGYGAFNPGVTFDNGIMQFGRGRGAPPYPNAQFWDYTQRELRDMATAATRSGRNEEAGAINGLRRSLLGELDSANPAFARARQGAAQFFGAENALEAGQNFVKSSANIGEARRAAARMSPAERELFARGYASNLADAVERSGDNRNVTLATFFNNPAAQQRTRLALGDQRARRLETLLRVEGVVDLARRAVQGNSTTARQLMEMGLAGGATAGAEGLLEQNFNPSHVLSAAILWGAARHGAQVIDQRVARRVGEMLVSGDPRILARGLQIATAQPQILNALRQATGAYSRGVTEAGVEGLHQKPGQGFKHGGKIHKVKIKGRQGVGRTDGGTADAISEDQDETLSRTMTHNTEIPAQPYMHPNVPAAVKGTSDFLRGGLSEVLKGQGVQLPEWSNRVGDVLQSEAANYAMGMASPLGGDNILGNIANTLSKTERFDWPVKLSYGKTIEMPVSVNPSRSMIQRELAQAPHGDVRALKAPNGDVYLWPANEAMHVDIADTFDLPFKTRQELQKASYLFNKADVDKLGRFKNFDDLITQLGASPDQPLQRDVLARGRSGRPIQTKPLPIGNENAVLEAGVRLNEPASSITAYHGSPDVLPRTVGRPYDPNRPIHPDVIREMQEFAAQNPEPELPGRPIHPNVLKTMRKEQEGRARGGRIIGAKTQSEVGLAKNEPGTTFRCGTCKYFSKGTCHNENPELKDRKVKPHWCCNLYDHAGMKVLA